MKFKGTIIGEASGSVASLTFSHNRGGQYIRQRSIPVNPGTQFQQTVRNATAQLTARWNGQLTQAQREAWDNYALQVPLPDSLGEPRNVGGIGMYNRSNVGRIQAGLAIVDDGPIVFNLGDLTPPVISDLDPEAQQFELAFSESDAWVQEDGGALLVYGSRAVSRSRNFFKGPYRFAVALLGSSTSPPTSPVAINNPFPFDSANQLFTQFRATRADGRLTSALRESGSFPTLVNAAWNASQETLGLTFDRALDPGTNLDASDLQLQIGGSSWTSADVVAGNQFMSIGNWTEGLGAMGEFVTYTRSASDLADINGLLVQNLLQFPVESI